MAKKGPTLDQFIEYMTGLKEQFGGDSIINIKSAMGFSEAGAMIIDDDTPAIMAGDDIVDGENKTMIFIMAKELQNTFNEMAVESENDGESVVLDSSGQNYTEEKKLII